MGSHPLISRERSAPGQLAAQADLFEGRLWVLTPSPDTSRTTLNHTLELVALCARRSPLIMDCEAHDRSHGTDIARAARDGQPAGNPPRPAPAGRPAPRRPGAAQLRADHQRRRPALGQRSSRATPNRWSACCGNWRRTSARCSPCSTVRRGRRASGSAPRARRASSTCSIAASPLGVPKPVLPPDPRPRLARSVGRWQRGSCWLPRPAVGRSRATTGGFRVMSSVVGLVGAGQVCVCWPEWSGSGGGQPGGSGVPEDLAEVVAGRRGAATRLEPGSRRAAGVCARSGRS